MKATIDEDGVLHIQSEGEVESYALRKWCEENANGRGQISSRSLVIQWGYDLGDDPREAT